MTKTEKKVEENNKKVIEVLTNGQYIKDLSFENPEAPKIYAEKGLKPEIKVSVDINVAKLQEEMYEVELAINATSTFEKKVMFISELTYAGIFTIKNAANEEELRKVLFIHCPSLLFPFARRIISDTTRDAAFPPLMLDTINFASLYEAKKDSITKTK